MKNIKKKILVWFNHKISTKSFENLKDGDYFLKYKIPYFCQFASRDKVKDYIYPEYSGSQPKNDPKWKDFGAKTKEDYAYWTMNSCGAVALRMVLESVGKHYRNNMEIINEGLEIGAFDDKPGWLHSGLIKMASKYNLKGKSATLSINGLCAEIFKNSFIIASVSPLLGEKDTPITRFGHLVLAKGFRWKDGKCEGLYINNPSGRELNLQENAFIPVERFKEGFTGRVIILGLKSGNKI